MKLEIVAVGEELGILFPDELMSRLGLCIGDDLELNETETGYLLVPVKTDDAGTTA